MSEDDFSSSLKDASAKDRIGFVKKVYSILFSQLLFTAVCIAATITIEDLANWMFINWWPLIPAFITVIFTEIMMLCVKPLRRKVPINYILLFLFTLAEAYIVSWICMSYSLQVECNEYGYDCTYNFQNREPIIAAATGTVAITAACTAYACTTKTDFTAKWGIIFVAGMAFFILSLFGLIFYDRIFQMMIATLGVFLFGVYLIFDTQLVMGGKRY